MDNTTEQNEYVLTDRDIIVTKTDLHGIITYVNDDLLRITGYSEEELIGTKHNIFRHPYMPSEVFADLWKTILKEYTWRGVIKNKTKYNGCYWVHADVTPLYENNKLIGFMSVRVKPSASELSSAKTYYDQMNSNKFKDKLLYGSVVKNNIFSNIKHFFDDIQISTKFSLLVGLSVASLVLLATLDNEELHRLTNKHLDIISQIQSDTYKTNLVNQNQIKTIYTDDLDSFKASKIEMNDYFYQIKTGEYLSLISIQNRNIVIVFSLIILMIFLYVIIIRSIIYPLKEAREGLKELSNGVYRIPVKYRSRNEIGRMMEALRTTSVRLGYDAANEKKISAKIIKAHEKNQLLNDQINQLQRIESIGRMTAGLAHNFNNILGSIIGYNQMNMYAGEDCNEEEIKQEILNNSHQVHVASAKAVELVKRMMAYAGQNAVRSLAPVIKPTSEVINEVVTLMQPLVTSRCHIDTDIRIEKTIEIDSYDLNQILTNLIVNAKDAMDNGAGIINISLLEQTIKHEVCTSCLAQLEGKFIELCVSDNGSGINSEIITHIFDPFFTTKSVGEGTGLGLSTVSGMIHECHGHIIVDSETSGLNHGTKFKLLFSYN